MLEYDVSKMILHSTDYKELFFQTGTFIDSLFLTRLPGKSTDKLAVKIEEYLQEHFAKPINHQQLSEKFGIVPSYLSKIFAKHKGISPAKYIVQLRMAKAKELLLEHPDWLAKDIAEIVGYPDPNYFSRIFKRETGLYPSEFRDQP
jgi:YesN/AraC family two-component response regulator